MGVVGILLINVMMNVLRNDALLGLWAHGKNGALDGLTDGLMY